MSVPTGKTLVGRASTARVAFQESSNDVRSYYALWQMLKGQRSAEKHLNSLGRGVYVLIAAMWESYCEDLALEAAQLLVGAASTPEELPDALAARIARELRADKHEMSPWKLAGDGWRSLTLDRVGTIARQTIFNTPKPAQVDELFERSIGLARLSENWRARDVSASRRPAEELREYVELRGAIAHGAKPQVSITKPKVSSFFQTVQQIVADTDSAVADYLRERVGAELWSNDLTQQYPALERATTAKDTDSYP